MTVFANETNDVPLERLFVALMRAAHARGGHPNVRTERVWLVCPLDNEAQTYYGPDLVSALECALDHEDEWELPGE